MLLQLVEMLLRHLRWHVIRPKYSIVWLSETIGLEGHIDLLLMLRCSWR